LRVTRLAGVAIYVALAVGFVWSLIAIVLTGPILVRRPPKLELPYELDVSPSRLRADVHRLCGEFGPRSSDHPDRLDDVAVWIAEEFRRAGLAVELQDYQLPEGRFRNVVGFREGLDAAAPVRVIGAHYDTVGGSPGADDNASGVAVMLELVRTLPPVRPRHSQYYVAFSTEEPPFFGTERMGSHVFARSLAERGIAVDLMVAMDLVGYYSDERGSQSFPVPGMGLLYPRRGNFLAVVGDLGSGRWIKRVETRMTTLTDLPIHTFRGPSALPGVMWSDHLSFRNLGMPGVLLTDTAFLRYPWYHSTDDTPDKLDYERMAQVVRGLHALVLDRDVAG
jgi:hypothetical protein